ncbi:MAG: hypothetical protein ACOC4M_14110 [Promethearchaeia archaeon]
MSLIANQILGIAKSIASFRNSKLELRIYDDRIEYSFKPSSSNEKFNEQHYRNVSVYPKDSAVPIKFNFDRENFKGSNYLSIFKNAITTDLYKSYMQNKAHSRIMNFEGETNDKLMYILYALAGLGIINTIILMAQYSG